MVSPVVTASTSKKLTYLPKGTWLEFTNLEAGAILESGYIISDAPLESIPLYLREGFALAVTKSAKHTTTANWHSLTWHLLPAEIMSGSLYEDAGDGFGASCLNQITGTLEDGVLILKKTMTGTLQIDRENEKIILYNISNAEKIIGAISSSFDSTRRCLTVEVKTTWTQLEIRF
jgi:alpha-glucosidase